MGNVRPLSTKTRSPAGCLIALCSGVIVFGLLIALSLWYGSAEQRDVPHFLIPLAIVAVGAGGIAAVVRVRRAHARAGGKSVWLPKAAVAAHARAEPATLRASAMPRWRFVLLTMFAVVWNVAVVASVREVVVNWNRTHGNGWGLLGVSLFVVVGLALVFGAVYSLLALFNPRPVVTLGKAVLAPGESTELAWEVRGRQDRLTRLVVTLEVREEVRYKRGTTPVTDSRVFVRLPVVKAMDRAEIRRGTATVTVPAGAMHSLSLPNNKVIWTLRVKGEIEHWPDVNGEFDVVVVPQGTCEREKVDVGSRKA